MKVILGLGNPGREYEFTRHNVGWWVGDHLADVWHLGGWRRDGEALVAIGRIGQHNVRVIKPQTYMNLSGAVVRPYIRRLTWDATSDLLVIVDDVALPIGRYRLRAEGSAGGHNGLRSVEAALGSRNYARLRIGIHPEQPERRASRGELADFVLSPFGKTERETVLALMSRFTDAAETWIRAGIGPAMNIHNRLPT